jgi:hypothetical protein
LHQHFSDIKSELKKIGGCCETLFRINDLLAEYVSVIIMNDEQINKQMGINIL